MRPAINSTRAFLYARSGCESQKATRNVYEQLQRLRKYSQDRSYVVVGEASDAAESGYKFLRPGLIVAMHLATRTPPTFDVLLVADVSRLARDARTLLRIRSCLTGRGIRTELVDPPTVLWEATRETPQRALRNFLGMEMGGRDVGE
ncbi:recombinase family protein [Rhizobium phaseoli]|uniref:recombinase family protein n=1 Tax=Rhizobium phaseoli TaxID=396 RepID=UPI000F888505|nr:recombinase family protein [Rhizobium phaseoli]